MVRRMGSCSRTATEVPVLRRHLHTERAPHGLSKHVGLTRVSFIAPRAALW